LFGHPAPAAKPTPSVPAGLILYAVGDIHGETAALDRLLARIAEDIEGRGDGRRAQLIFLGDYVDRGSDSAGVLDRLCVGPLPGVDGRFLAGNHEQAMLDFLEDPTGNAGWLAFGGVATLASYGIRASAGSPDSTRCRALRDQLVERLPDSHLTFLRGLESHAMVGDYLFVHAGIRPGRRVEDQTREDLLWIREPFLSSHRDHGKIVVHGHTVVDQPEIRTNRIAIDTGAYATGILTALVLSETAHKILQS
jgi:serine/threonine protein phosphatase 1